MKHYDDSPRIRSFRPPYVAAGLALVIFLVMTFIWLQPRIKGMERVPRLIGETLADARKVLEAADFEVEVESLTGEPLDTWLVTDQTLAGEWVKPGDKVHLVVTPPFIALPPIQGMTVEEANKALLAAGFKLGDVVESWSRSVRAGYVIDALDQPGQAFQGSTIRLMVSKGPEELLMPNLVGLSPDQARNYLKNLDINIARTLSDITASMPPDTITRTKPVAGTDMKTYTEEVILFVNSDNPGN